MIELKNLFKKHVTFDFDKLSPVNKNARGIPVPTRNMALTGCANCKGCETSCPTKAIQIKSSQEISFDYGACLQCGICVSSCPSDKLENSNFIYTFSRDRKELVIEYNKADFVPKEFSLTENQVAFQKLTKGKGFNYREVAASGNNSVECELNASFNNVFDSEGQQIRSVASPKHADAIVFSGPVGENMVKPLQIAWDTMPEPKALIAAGTEAIMGGVFIEGAKPKNPDLFIAGDPPRPDVLLQAFRYLMGVFNFSFQKELKKRIQELRQNTR
jgi:Ni,Fe-hydrogenase III small subunit/ferredoxin